jgi:hypothetical protein
MRDCNFGFTPFPSSHFLSRRSTRCSGPSIFPLRVLDPMLHGRLSAWKLTPLS